ncbi:Phosphatidylethanolamine-binding protein PEBP containing protein [Cricetulus griseus]|nr:Phosphatidylethanolamine-binding protein PEBP containing protein [Cricetulus griseus]
MVLLGSLGSPSRIAALTYLGAGTLTSEPPQHGFPGTNFTTQHRVYYTFQTKGSDIKAGNIRGNVITDYQPPSPPPTTGLHRYQFFVYLQGDRDISIPTKENRNRASWKLEKFLQDHKLQSHESSTQYMTEHDDTVLQYYKMNEAKGKSSET